MEKRALIAFVLSMLVLFFWEYYFGIVKTPETPPQQQSEQTVPAPSTTQPQAPPPPAVQSIAPRMLPDERLTRLEKDYESWTADSPIYDMQVLAPGARMSSFILKKFRQQVAPDSPPMQMVPTQASGYLPLAVDLLFHKNWDLSTRPYTSDAPAKVSVPAEGEPRTLTFQTEIDEPSGHLRVTKILTLIPGTYLVDAEFRLKNLSKESLADQMGISFFFQPYSDIKTESSYNPSQFSYYQKGSVSALPLKELVKKPDTVLKPPMDWIGYENNYFLQAVIPLETSGYQVVPRVLDADKGLIQVVYLTDPFQIEPDQEKSFKMRLYVGAKELGQLNLAEHNLSGAVDYGWFTFLAKPLLYVLKWFYGFLGNYGWAIILLTVLIKIVFWPLTHKSYQSMQKMKKVQPKIAQIREQYKDDKEKLNQELMNVYRTYKVNPMGGCLPMVLQIPVFFALYRMLNGAVELRHEPFMLWINDLTAPDRLHVGFEIPYLGGIPVLTLLMGITMFIQQKMTPSAGDPRQEQIMLLMPVMFTVFFINFPSGLVLYWLVNNILSIAQQYWINRNA